MHGKNLSYGLQYIEVQIILIGFLTILGWSQIYPEAYKVHTPALSENGSSTTGHCSDVSDSGRVCNTPRTSVLFDGIPTLPGLDGDMWASELLILSTSLSNASITFNFTTIYDKNGADVTDNAHIDSIEMVMFYCPAREIGLKSPLPDGCSASASCENLVRVCLDIQLFDLSEVTLSLNYGFQRIYLAEVFFYDSDINKCSQQNNVNHPLPISELNILPTSSILQSSKATKLIEDSTTVVSDSHLDATVSTSTDSNRSTVATLSALLLAFGVLIPVMLIILVMILVSLYLISRKIQTKVLSNEAVVQVDESTPNEIAEENSDEYGDSGDYEEIDDLHHCITTEQSLQDKENEDIPVAMTRNEAYTVPKSTNSEVSLDYYT